MGIESEAARAAAYGFPGVSVDGRNIFAVYEAAREAAASIRSGGGPVLLELVVDRLLPHTSDDDHTKYRSAMDILEMQGRDPLDLTRQTLKNMGIMDDDEDRKIHQDARRAVIEATDKAEELPYPGIETMYDHVYADRGRVTECHDERRRGDSGRDAPRNATGTPQCLYWGRTSAQEAACSWPPTALWKNLAKSG